MAELDRLVSRLESVTSKLESILASQDTNAAGDQSQAKSHPDFASHTMEAPRIILLFDEALKEDLSEFSALGSKIGGDVSEGTKLAIQAIDALRCFVWSASGTKQPGEQALLAMLKPISDKIEALQSLKTSKRNTAFFNHLSAIAEGIPALGWVTVSPTPAPFVREMTEASQFYVNRVLKDFKEKDKIHADWAKCWVKLLTDMQSYVKQNHTTGLVWNSSPGSQAPSGKAAGDALRRGPPAAPPTPPASYMKDALKDESTTGSTQDNRAALFADINKGMAITQSLKKVPDDMKTHKNPALKQQMPPPIAPKTDKVKGQAIKLSATPAKNPPKVELEGGKKWIIEFVESNNNVVIEAKDMKQVVYIYKCLNTVIQIKGKLNSITMDNCNKTSIVFDDLVSSLELINCQRAQVQSMGKMPTLTIQKTDGCQIYLSKASMNAEIVTSKSSEMNILIPNANGEYDEFPVPEQYKTVWNGKKLCTSVVDIA